MHIDAITHNMNYFKFQAYEVVWCINVCEYVWESSFESPGPVLRQNMYTNICNHSMLIEDPSENGGLPGIYNEKML